jgi:QLQ
MNRWRGAPFTAAQWQELETQALIFKYFVAGVQVPPDLLMAVRTSFEAMAAARYYHHSRKPSVISFIYLLFFLSLSFCVLGSSVFHFFFKYSVWSFISSIRRISETLFV